MALLSKGKKVVIVKYGACEVKYDIVKVEGKNA